MSAVCLRLDGQIENVGDVLIQVYYQGQASNRVRMAVGHLGGGPLDDPGSRPTPIPPPSLIRGLITLNGSPLPGVTVSLSGDASAATTTDNNGNYSILTQSAGEYVLSAAKENTGLSFSSRQCRQLLFCIFQRLSHHRASHSDRWLLSRWRSDNIGGRDYPCPPSGRHCK